MKGDSRVEKSILNAKVNTICFFVSMIISFFSRKIFLEMLGTSFMGLTSTLMSLLGFLNIAELGIGVAIGYVLYKPISENDQLRINDLVSVMGYLYRRIGHLILVLGIILSLFFPLIFKGEKLFDYGVIYFGFYAYLISSLIGYYINYKQILLSADQRNYEVTGYYQIVGVLITITQICFALFTQSFYVFFTIQLLGGIAYSFILNWRIRKVYPWLTSEVSMGKKMLKEFPEIVKYIKQIFIHKVGSFVQFQFAPILIYSFVSLPVVALYANYSILAEKIQGMINGVLNSTAAGVGNLVAEGDNDKIWRIYKQLLVFRFFISGVLVSCFLFLVSDFIELWLGSQYVLTYTTAFLISLSLYLQLTRGTTEQFIGGYGLFYDVWAAVIESLIFILASIIFGFIYGLNGVLIGPVISTALVIHFWKPYFLFMNGLRRKLFEYYKEVFFYSFSTILCYIICVFIIDNVKLNEMTWVVFVQKAMLFFILNACIHFIIFYLLSVSFRLFVRDYLNRVINAR